MKIDQIKETPGHLLRRAQQISTALFAEEMAEFDLTSVQFVALATIVDSGEIDATRLAEIIAFDRATIGGVIERLERKGLVERRQSQADKRAKVVTARPSGRALIQVCTERVGAVQQRLLAPLSMHERATFTELLSKVARVTV